MTQQREYPVIAHYHPVWLPGTMTWLHELVRGASEFSKNIVICEENTRDEQFSIADVYSFGDLGSMTQLAQRVMKKVGVVESLPYYSEVLRFQKARLLHSHFGHIAYTGSFIAAECGIPHVASFYGMDLRQIPLQDSAWLNKYAMMFSKTSRIFCEGEYMAGTIAQLGCMPEKITVHPLGINLEKIPFQPKVWDSGEPLRILIAAGFREKKGIPLALQAVARIAQTTAVRVTIIGDASSDTASSNEKIRIMDTIRNEGISEIVDLRGFASHEQLLEAARTHHVFLSPSFHARDGDCEGGAPVSIIEMAAAGLIVVSSKHCDIPGVVAHEKTGWLCVEKDLEDLVVQLKSAVASRDRWPEMARGARAHVESRFNSRLQGQKLFEHYRQIIHEGDQDRG